MKRILIPLLTAGLLLVMGAGLQSSSDTSKDALIVKTEKVIVLSTSVYEDTNYVATLDRQDAGVLVAPVLARQSWPVSLNHADTHSGYTEPRRYSLRC